MSTSVVPERLIRTVDPASGEPLAAYEPHDVAAVDRALARAVKAFERWRNRRIDERAADLRRVAAHLRERAADYAALMTREMGKPIVESEAEIEKCAWSCDHYAEHAGAYLAPEEIASSATRSYVAFRPLGVVLAIMPWNFPFWQVFRAAAPALMAGNVVVLKHAANVTGCALAIERAFAECGLSGGVFSTLVVAGREMGSIVSDPRVAAVTLTGSEGAGSAVATVAGAHLKKAVLELGGSDAYVVLADADVEAAARMAVRARFGNAGQSCIAAKRFIVEEALYDAFLAHFIEATRALRVGDPLDRGTQVGPLAREDLRESLERQLESSLVDGATLELGGRRLERPGYYYAPTIVGGVTESMSLFVEETFGPAAAVVRARDAEHALKLANTSAYGLGGSLWTRDLARAEEFAVRFESGACFINGMTVSDPRLPFGGIKRSGFGRELSHFGIREFTNVQTVWIGPTRS